MPHPVIRAVRSRLVFEGTGVDSRPLPRRRLYRPLVVGPAMLQRHGPGEPWTARVSTDGRLAPTVPRSLAFHRPTATRRPGDMSHRLAAALVAPQDIDGPPARLVAEQGPNCSEFYGWALLYQLPGMRGSAFVDAHERFCDLPAFFESPAELVDRATFLASRGVLSRPLALFTQPADFVITATGRLRNRFFPAGRFRRPADLGWFR